MKKMFVLAVTALLVIVTTHQAQSSEYLGKYPECIGETPLPEFRITPAAEDVGDAARFLGVWGGGRWNEKTCNTIVVKKVIKDDDGMVENDDEETEKVPNYLIYTLTLFLLNHDYNFFIFN